jgi:hypothetical protein
MNLYRISQILNLYLSSRTGTRIFLYLNKIERHFSDLTGKGSSLSRDWHKS